MISGLSGGTGCDSSLLQQLRDRMFNRLDANSDGSIDQTEFAAGRPDGASADDAAARFERIDSDGNGSLTQAELQSAFQQFTAQTQGALVMAQGQLGSAGDSGGSCHGAGGGSKAAADTLFSRLDTDGDGSVSKSELAAAFQSVAAADGTDATAATQAADDLFTKLDADGDGAVSQSETEQAMRPHGHHHHREAQPSSGTGTDLFAQLDANGDGSISKAEFEAARGQSAGSSAGASANTGTTATATATAAGTSADPQDDATSGLLAMLRGTTGQQTANTVRAQMMDLLLKLQSVDGTPATAAAAA